MPTSSQLHRWEGDTLHIGDEGVIQVKPNRDRTAKLKVREGLRMVLTGLEELWRLPRSVETKKEQGRR